MIDQIKFDETRLPLGRQGVGVGETPRSLIYLIAFSVFFGIIEKFNGIHSF
jgi:hypothetical protein